MNGYLKIISVKELNRVGFGWQSDGAVACNTFE